MEPKDSGNKAGPLVGMTVIECASIVLGPMTARYLADMGANVIKVEPPEGDLTRRIGPRRNQGMGSLFLANNRNKRSIVLDLKVPEAQKILQKLVSTADVFLHSIRSSAAERLGLGYEELRAHNEKLVYCHVQGFSDEGPYAGKPAYDDIIQSLSGLAQMQTVIAGEPRYLPTIVADKVTAVHAAHAITLALLHRWRTGEGQAVHVPMFETMADFNVVEHLWGYAFDPPLGPMGYEPVSTGSRRPFKTKDGYLAVLPYSDIQWHRFFDVIGRSEIMADERFATHAARQENIFLVWDEIGRQVALRTNSEWTTLLETQDIPFSVVNSIEDLTTDPHLNAVEFWEFIDDPVEGRLRFPRNPLQFSASPASIRSLPPRLGQHTAEILLEAGCSQDEINELIENGGTRLFEPADTHAGPGQ